MADGGTGEKTEEPTPERLRKLRKEGNVAKSQDITIAISFLGVFCVIAAVFPFIGDSMFALFHKFVYAATAGEHLGRAVINNVLMEAMITFFKVVAPALAAAFVLGIVMNVAQVGFMFTLKPITPDIKKINPVNGIKNLINKKKLVELLRS